MGFRYRKSINLGGGFKINLSKSGIGYSWGTKGYRITKTAKGTTRRTTSIPGTGVSWVQESKRKNVSSASSRSNSSSTQNRVENNNYYDTQEVKNASASTMVSAGLEDMLAAASKSLKLYRLVSICFWTTLILGFAYPLLLLLALVCFIFGVYLNKKAVINLEYTFEDDQATLVEERMTPLINITKSKKIWYISQTNKVIDKKYAAGASGSVKRNKCKASTKIPFPFKTNSYSVSFKLGKETILFLPDKLFVIQGAKIGALNYSDVTTSVHGQRFIEREAVPKDAKIVDYTWQYVNKSGGPDSRFKNNKKIPVCMYGEIDVKSPNGMNTQIMFSNINIQ